MKITRQNNCFTPTPTALELPLLNFCENCKKKLNRLAYVNKNSLRSQFFWRKLHKRVFSLHRRCLAFVVKSRNSNFHITKQRARERMKKLWIWRKKRECDACHIAAWSNFRWKFRLEFPTWNFSCSLFFPLLPPKVVLAALFGDTAKKQRDEKKTEIELKIVSNDSRRRVIKLNLKGRKKKRDKIFPKEKFPFSLNNVDEKKKQRRRQNENMSWGRKRQIVGRQAKEFRVYKNFNFYRCRRAKFKITQTHSHQCREAQIEV